MSTQQKTLRKKAIRRFELKKLQLVFFIVFGVLTVFTVIVLDNSFGRLPSLGKFLSPQHGFWQNAEKSDFNAETQWLIESRNLSRSEVFFDERLVPHIMSSNDADAYFLQGYVHAKYRLWQMDFLSRVASGRTAEVIGKRGIETDKLVRHCGLKYIAEDLAHEIENTPEVKRLCDEYAAGANAYIASLTYSQLPLEYKIFSYTPEKWSTYKTALVLILKGFDEIFYNQDLSKTWIAKAWGEKVYRLLYPAISTIDVPTFFSTTDFDVPLKPIKDISLPSHAYSFFFEQTQNGLTPSEPRHNFFSNRQIGSSSWALSPQKSTTGKAILCHNTASPLSLPNQFYELQINTPSHNVYGFSLPGVPCIIEGFNDHAAWALNTPTVDVKDYFEVQFYNADKQLFYFQNEWKKTEIIEEVIKVKDGIDVKENCINTFLGRVLYTENNTNKGLLLKWTLSEKSNELKAFYELNKMKNYNDFKKAIKYFNAPAQNVLYADIDNNIALHLEGKIPARADLHGDFIMPLDTAFLWKYFIPFIEKPFLYNPSSQFVLSSNQCLFYPSIYPYYLGTQRGAMNAKRVYDFLTSKERFTIDDMLTLQNDNYSAFAEAITPLLLEYINPDNIDTKAKKYYKILKMWSYRYDNEEAAPTILETWLQQLHQALLGDNIKKTPILKSYKMNPIALLYMLQNNDKENPLVDDIHTTHMVETWQQIIKQSFDLATVQLNQLSKHKKLEWGLNKKYTLRHPLKQHSLSTKKMNFAGGMDKLFDDEMVDYAPHSKMVVHLTQPIEAYVSHSGGQSGNPGSYFYDNDVTPWAEGQFKKVLYITNKNKIDKLKIVTRTSFIQEKKSFF